MCRKTKSEIKKILVVIGVEKSKNYYVG